MTKLKLFLILSSLVTITLPSYAGQEACPEDSAHCAYVTGLSGSVEDGRYIKLSNKKVSLMVCFNSSGTAFISKWGAKRFAGMNADEYAICSDALGKNCEQIGIDRFFISKAGDEYIADPAYFNIDLSRVKDKYPPCAYMSKQEIKLG